jgi:hypothetical protein
MSVTLDKAAMLDSLRLACSWITDVAMNHTDAPRENANEWKYDFSSWRGAMLEYVATGRRWWGFGPTWHTGQAVKSLVLAHRVLGDPKLLEFAREGAEFLLRERIKDPQDPDFGALLAYEADGGAGALLTNTSGMLEALDGLMYLGDQTGDPAYWDAAIACLTWIERRAFIRDQGLFYDRFSTRERTVGTLSNPLLGKLPGRPLLDDGVFLKGYRKTGNRSFRDVFFRTADRLMQEEDPPGNWIRFPPASSTRGTIHPRHAFWWGRPMVMAWQEAKAEGATSEHREADAYLQCARRSADWYVNAQRKDGGFFRGTYLDFKTDSFGHATSGVLSACSLWRDLIVAGAGDEYREPLRLALSFGLSMQFKTVEDPNLRGAILEKVNPPNGTDRLPYNVRDLASIFYVQAVSMAVMDGLL